MENVIIFGYSLYEIAAYFFIYGFLGWCLEVIFHAVKCGKFVNRGFLNGPICPIYAFGAVIAMLALTPVMDNPFLLYVFGGLLATLLELVTGFVLEKFFHTKWWDYSSMHFNFKGYICLEFTLLWGVGFIILFDVLHPVFVKAVALIPLLVGKIIVYTFIVTIITDLVLTILQLLKLNERYKKIEQLNEEMRKSSDKIGESIANITIKANEDFGKLRDKVKSSEEYAKLQEKIKNSRVVKAFPSLKDKHKK